MSAARGSVRAPWLLGMMGWAMSITPGAAGADDANQLVISALRDQGKGLVDESNTRLKEALAASPNHELAQSLLGKFRHGEEWTDYGSVRDKKPETDPKYQRYLEKRAAAAPTAESQLDLGEWCLDEGLRERAVAHWMAATRLDPSTAKAWTRLGYRRASGRWVSEEQLQRERDEAARLSQLEDHWFPIVSVIAKQIRTGNDEVRADAKRRLDAIDDPEALPSVWKALVMGRWNCQPEAAQMFDRIQAPEASRALTLMATYATDPKLRDWCGQRLSQRDPRDYAGTLIGLLASPVRFTTGRSSSGIGGREYLVAEGEDLIIRRLYTTLNTFDPAVRSAVARDRIRQDMRTILAYNSQVKSWNAPIVDYLIKVTGRELRSERGLGGMLPSFTPGPASAPGGPSTVSSQPPGLTGSRAANKKASRPETGLPGRSAPNIGTDSIDGWTLAELSQFGYHSSDLVLDSLENRLVRRDDRESWKRWWLDQEGLTPTSTAKRVVNQPVYLQAPPPPPTGFAGSSIPRECFVAGTIVLTEAGPRAIETLELGDLVLSQDVTTGKLGFQPIVALHHNPPQATLRLRLVGEELVCTPTHRFWQVGEGWVMGRALKPGDLVRTMKGPVRVESVTPEAKQPVFNLEIEKTQTYLVGASGVLSHDYGPVAPVRRPFDSADRGPLAPAEAAPK